MSKKKRTFKAEVSQLLDLVVHSLYSKKEIFLRELVSNSSDAIDRARFESLTDGAEDSTEWKIRLQPNKEARTLTISDNGVGMTMEEIEKNIGTIANSGTGRFLKNLREQGGQTNAPELIGQFGVGFYSAFMVADKVELTTKRRGANEPAIKWTSAGESGYTLEEVEREAPGTDVVLHLREGMDEYLEEYRLRGIIREYSDYISFPIVMDVTRTQPAEEEGAEPVTTIEETTLNSMKSIWKRNKDEVTEEEYKDFYQHISHDYSDPLEIIHYRAEGMSEFQALLYLPKIAPMDLFMREGHKGIHLYVRNVFITDSCKELLPTWLRFVNGVVDSSDLPLNVSREMLQDDAVIRRIRKNLVGRILNTLADLKKDKPEDFKSFMQQFGAVLKEGVHAEPERKEKILELVGFPSSNAEAEQPVTLDAYVERMPEAQSAIYYLSAETLEQARKSPLLEAFKAREYEVLFLTEPVDEWVVQSLPNFKEKPLQAIDSADLNLDSEQEKKEKEASREENKKEYAPLLERLQKQLEDHVSEVRLSDRLTDSPCCLVASQHAMSPHMERIMKAMNQEVPEVKRILEINPSHPVVEGLQQAGDQKEADSFAETAAMLYDLALIAEGSPIPDPAAFSKRISMLMTP